MRPTSVRSSVALSTSQFRRSAVQTSAAAGPYTTLQGWGEAAVLVLASSMEAWRSFRGIHLFHIALAQCTMTSLWAMKAGSALPLSEPSAIMRAMSNS